MSNDKTTLADAQPGGRVRLGDQAERARFEAWAHAQSYRGGNIMADRDSAHPDVYADPIAQLTWKSWQAALSAQPSPGGHGDARAQFEAWARSIGACVDADGHGNYADSHLNSAKLGWDAAAARQPVGEPVAWLIDWPGEPDLGHYFAEEPVQGGRSRPLYAAPPAQAVDPWSVIDRVAKNWDGCSIGPAIRAEAEKVIGQPAQAVGLGQSLPLIARALAEWREDDGNVLWWAWCGREWAGEPAWAGTPNDSDWPGYHTHWTPHPSHPALIDSQAVGNG
nr:hypothetical protein [Stenotrophomonas pavanii]